MTDHPDPTKKSVIIERELPHPPEKIWRALTEGPLLELWLLKNDFRPVVGHRFNLRLPPMPKWDGVIDCEVLVIEPPSRLSYTWDALGLKSVVTFTLTPTTGARRSTHLRMEQSGFPSEETASYKGAAFGWQKFLDGLERIVAGLE